MRVASSRRVSIPAALSAPRTVGPLGDTARSTDHFESASLHTSSTSFVSARKDSHLSRLALGPPYQGAVEVQRLDGDGDLLAAVVRLSMGDSLMMTLWRSVRLHGAREMRKRVPLTQLNAWSAGTVRPTRS